jgi:uroporphyrinogen decarboxylase
MLDKALPLSNRSGREISIDLSIMFTKMNARERFNAVTHFEKPDRVPNEDFGYWDETIERWYGEGLPRSSDVEEYLGLDNRREKYLLSSIFVGAFPEREERRPIYIAPMPKYGYKVLEDDGERIVIVDTWGIKKMVRKSLPTIPKFLDFPVKTMKDFEAYKVRLDPRDPERFPSNWPELVQKYKVRDHPLGLNFVGFFGHPRNLMGLTNLSAAYVRDPELVRAILDHWCDFLIEISKKALQDVQLDFVQIWEDMAYNRGSLISPRIFKEFMTPYYQRLTRFLRENGVDVILVDCDGDVNDLIPLFLEGGANGIYPLEVRCNVDPVALRKKYGKRLILSGGIDKFALMNGPEAIDAELRKLPELLPLGGYIPTVDHRVPADVSFDNYKYYVKQKTKLILEASE